MGMEGTSLRGFGGRRGNVGGKFGGRCFVPMTCGPCLWEARCADSVRYRLAGPQSWRPSWLCRTGFGPNESFKGPWCGRVLCPAPPRGFSGYFRCPPWRCSYLIKSWVFTGRWCASTTLDARSRAHHPRGSYHHARRMSSRDIGQGVA